MAVGDEAEADPRYLVDTSVWIFALRRGRGRHDAITRRVEELLEVDAVATTGLVALELLGGATNETEYDQLALRLRGLHWIPVDDDDWRNGARILYSLRRKGITVPPTDAFLAGLAIRHGHVLLHADHDFDAISADSQALRVESMVALVGKYRRYGCSAR